MKSIASLALACGRMEGDGRDLAVEQLLSRLIDDYPNVARLIAPILAAKGDRTGKELAKAVKERVGDYEGAPFMNEPVGLSVDYLILTVKKVELTACLRVFGVAVRPDVIQLGHGLEAWTANVDNRTFAIAMVGTAGNVESALRLGALLTLIRAKASILIGMSGGVLGLVKEGDVVVAESVLAYEFAQMKRGGPMYMPRAYSPPERHISRMELLDVFSPGWAADVRRGFQSAFADHDDLSGELSQALPTWSPRVHRGVVLAGSKLIEDGSLPKLRIKLHARTLAAEMEGAGFAAACTERDVPWLVVRGIADHGQDPRPTHWQLAASYAAARFVRDGLQNERIDLLV